MINEIKDHFILVDKCAEETRIVEIKSKKLLKLLVGKMKNLL